MGPITANSKSRPTPFKTAHLLEYGLAITQRDPKTLQVCSVSCQFCTFFGHEQIAGQKRQRKQTENEKFWGPPFRPEYYRDHSIIYLIKECLSRIYLRIILRSINKFKSQLQLTMSSCKSSKVLRIFKSNEIITIIQQKIKSHPFFHMSLSNSKDVSLYVLLLNIFLVLNNFGLTKE